MQDADVMDAADRWLTVRQPWADLILAGAKDVENRSWPVPSTLPHRCSLCKATRRLDDGTVHHRFIGCTSRHVTPFPFTLGIHSAKRMDDTPGLSDRLLDLSDALGLPTIPSPFGGRFPAATIERAVARQGMLLGTVDVIGCHHADDCYAKGHYPEGGGCTCGAGNPMHERGCGLEPWCSPWAQPGAYHWTLTRPQTLATPVPWPGRLNLWRLDP